MEYRKNIVGDGNGIIYRKNPRELCTKMVQICSEEFRGKMVQKYISLVTKEENRKMKAP